jgi:hypothetical protein
MLPPSKLCNYQFFTVSFSTTAARTVSSQFKGIFLFTTKSIPALGFTQPPIQWAPGASSLGVKRPGREADNSPPSSDEVKEFVELYFHHSNTPSWHVAQLKSSTGTTLPLPLVDLKNIKKLTKGLLKCLQILPLWREPE